MATAKPLTLVIDPVGLPTRTDMHDALPEVCDTPFLVQIICGLILWQYLCFIKNQIKVWANCSQVGNYRAKRGMKVVDFLFCFPTVSRLNFSTRKRARKWTDKMRQAHIHTTSAHTNTHTRALVLDISRYCPVPMALGTVYAAATSKHGRLSSVSPIPVYRCMLSFSFRFVLHHCALRHGKFCSDFSHDRTTRSNMQNPKPLWFANNVQRAGSVK